MDRQLLSLAAYLASAGNAAPSADNSQPFQFSWDGDSLAICFSRERGGKGIFGAMSHATLLSLGGVVENIDAAASAIGQTINWAWIDAKGNPYAAAVLEKGLPGIGEQSHELPIFLRHTNRFPYTKTSLPAEAIKYLTEISLGGARLISINDEGGERKRRLVHCIKIAAEARFCNQELHDWLINSLRFSVSDVERGEGLDVATLNLPPGSGLFMRITADWRRMSLLNKLGIYKLLALTEIQLLGAAPTLVCLVGKDDFAGLVDAGRLLSRVWTGLNAMGLAVHPYYVVTDQLARLKEGKIPQAMVERVTRVGIEVPGLLNLKDGEVLQMVLRVGFPKIKAPPRSRRLPIEAYFESIS